METYEVCIYLSIEVFICLIISFLLLFYYSRKNTNPVVLVTAYFTWSLNFILIVLLPYDLFRTGDSHPVLKTIITYSYIIIYWSLFFFSWIFIPLMQDYEDSGEFTKLAKLKSSIRTNLKFYIIMLIICVVIFVIALINSIKSSESMDLNKKIINYSFLIGNFIFYIFLSYGMVKYPKNLYKKMNYYTQVKYMEWRVQKDYDKLQEINYDLLNLGSRLYSTIEVSRNESFLTDDDINNTKNNKKNVENRENQKREVKDYIEYINKNYDELSKTSSDLGFEFDKKSKEESKPITELEDLIKVNRKINKKKLRNLRLQCKIRRTYNHWAVLCSILFFKKLKESKNIDDDKENIINDNKENLVEVENDNKKNNLDEITSKLEKERFIPLKQIGNCQQSYYMIIRKIFLFLLLVIFALFSCIVIVLQIFIIFNIHLGVIDIDKDGINIFVLHFIVIFSILFLFSMSLYALFKIKVSGYFNMYGHRQTDSVSLMYFSSNLCRISFAICIDFINLYEIFVSGDNSTANTYFYNNMNDVIRRYCPIILILLSLFFMFDVHIKIANRLGFSFFGIESEEVNDDIKDGHEYLMKLNKKMNGKKIKFNDNVIFK